MELQPKAWKKCPNTRRINGRVSSASFAGFLSFMFRVVLRWWRAPSSDSPVYMAQTEQSPTHRLQPIITLSFRRAVSIFPRRRHKSLRREGQSQHSALFSVGKVMRKERLGTSARSPFLKLGTMMHSQQWLVALESARRSHALCLDGDALIVRWTT